MTTDPYLGFTLVASSQNQKEVTFNANDMQLSAAMNANLAIVFTANARTLTALEFTSYFVFVCGALTGTGTLTVPQTARFFAVDNSANGAHGVTVEATLTGSFATVPASGFKLMYSDGASVKLFT